MADQIIVQSNNQNVYVAAGSSPDNMTVHLANNNLANAIGYPPKEFANTNGNPLSGYVYFTFFTPLISLTVSTITMASSSTASSGVTAAKMGLYTADDTTLTLVARTANDTTLFNAINTLNTRSFDTTGGYPSTYTLVAGQRYATAHFMTATTMGNRIVRSVNNLLSNASPKLAGIIAGATDLPTTQLLASVTTNTAQWWTNLE